MCNHRLTGLASLVFVVLALASSAKAQYATYYFPLDATINYTLGASTNGGSAIVGYDNDTDVNNQTNGTSPTVYIEAGAFIAGYVDVYNDSELIMTGGSVQQGIYGVNNSIDDFTGGVDINYTAEGNSITNFMGGSSVEQTVEVFGTSSITVSGGRFNTLDTSYPAFYDLTSGPFEFMGLNLSDFSLGGNYYELEGSFANGDSANGLEIYDPPTYGNTTVAGFTIINIPEPGPLGRRRGRWPAEPALERPCDIHPVTAYW